MAESEEAEVAVSAQGLGLAQKNQHELLGRNIGCSRSTSRFESEEDTFFQVITFDHGVDLGPMLTSIPLRL